MSGLAKKSNFRNYCSVKLHYLQRMGIRGVRGHVKKYTTKTYRPPGAVDREFEYILGRVWKMSEIGFGMFCTFWKARRSPQQVPNI